MLRSFLMAKILILTADDTNISYTRTRDALVGAGHTTAVSTQTSASGLDSALATVQPDLLLTVRSSNAVGFRDWVRSKWNAGVPVIAGGMENLSPTNATHHLVSHLGMMTGVITIVGEVAGRHMDTWPYTAGHPIVDGRISTTISAGNNIATRSQGGTIYGDIVGAYGSTGTVYMSAVEKDAPIASGTAPARAVFIGWLYAGQNDYTSDAKEVLGNAVTWVSTVHVVEIPVSFAATPATASALMTDAAFDNASHVSVSAPAASASAITNDAVVSATRDPNIKRVLSPGSSGGAAAPQNLKMGYYTGWNVSFSFKFAAPGDEAKPHPDDTFESMVLNLAVVSVETPPMGGYFNVQYTSASAGFVSTRVDIVDGKWLYRIPLHTDITGEISIDHRNVTGRVSVDNPINDLGTQSYFDVEVNALNRTTVAADPMTATALMANADGSVLNSVSIGAVTATASAEMPGGSKPDAEFTVAASAATATMLNAYFKSNRKVTAEPMTASGEFLDLSEYMIEKELTFTVDAPGLTMAWSVEPLTVNDVAIDNDRNDRYFLRLTGREVDGTRVPVASNWFRFNERSGNTVRMYNALTGLPSTGNQPSLEGAFSWGHPGPNGRRAVSIASAGLNVSSDDTWGVGSNFTAGASLEFTVKVAPGHTGRMDIANGTMQPQNSPGNWANSHISVRDGKLYALTGPSYAKPGVNGEFGKGGTSMRRIDDGKFHHVVITPRPGDYSSPIGENIPLDIYIDGVLDRSFMTLENRANVSQAADPRFFARPDHYFGQETGYPFQGEILEVVYRRSSMSSSQVMDLYLDMFGFKAIRAGIVGAAVGAMGDAKVETNMKRMLVLSFGNPPSPGLMQQTDNNKFGVLVNEQHRQNLTEMFVHGQGDDLDIGNYLMSYQRVEFGIAGDPASEMRRDRGDEPFGGYAYQFRDEKTGLQRFIDINRDVNLDHFDVIFVQAYNNPALNTQAQRDLYEPFFESLNKALVDGKKLWITDPYLAADLGWVTAVDQVPVIAIGNDVRSYDVAPFPEALGTGAKPIPQPIPRPADGSMPELPQGIPQGSAWGLFNLWRWDIHHNTGYRVVNEIDGMTNLPSWEVDEMYMRDRREMLPDDWEWETYGYRLANRSGEDFEWKVKRMNNYIGTDLDDGSGVVFDNVKPSTGTGLKAGDEFYDYVWYEQGYNWFKYAGSASRATGDKARLNRATSTWAVPMGHLRVGTPVSTFRSTMHDDFGREVPNPYRNHIRNAVVRPGDRLPDGRKVMGYALMEFAMRPDVTYLSGRGIEKQLTLPVDEYTAPEDIVQNTQKFILPETPYSFDWDYAHHGRVLFGASGTVTMVSYTSVSRTTTRKGQTKISTAWIKRTESLPSAQNKIEWYPIRILPHLDWVSRGLAWLFTVENVETEYSNYAATAATATGRVTGAQVDTEYDNTVTVGAAKASANIVAPAEAQVKEVSVFAAPATATGKMNGIPGGYKAEPAQAFATMPQNVLRPLDIEEVLFFTVTMNQKTINLRMEEN